MQGDPSLDESLVQAKTQEKQYKWLHAMKSYDEAKARVLGHENFQKAGDFQERFGFCFQNAAMQAETTKRAQGISQEVRLRRVYLRITGRNPWWQIYHHNGYALGQICPREDPRSQSTLEGGPVSPPLIGLFFC
jgi:hypothetical protein